jgi:thioesterase domain-containing protein/acyl carrier protein
VDDVRRSLRERLPDYMVPAAFVKLDALPLTSNGKVDRKALPAAELGGAGAVAPRNATERELAAIWKELLGRESVGVTDDFFALGGHSLLAVTLVERVRERLGRELPLRALFEHATIERLAASLDGEDGNLVTLRDGDATPLVLVHPIGGDVFAYRQLAARLDRPVLALRATAALNDASLEELAAHYVAELRARVDGPCVLGGWSFGGVVAMEMARQMGERAERVVLIDSWIARDAVATAREAGVRQFLGDVAASRGLALPDDVDSIDAAAEAAKRAGIVVDAAVLARQFEIYAANCRRLAGYVPRPYDTRALLVATDARPRGWSALVRDLRTLEVGGDHYSLLTHDLDALLPVLQLNREVPIAADIP